MVAEPPVLGKPPSSREEEADGALRSTSIRPGWAWTLTLAFLALIACVPALQITVERRRDPGRLPQPLRLASLLAQLPDVSAARTPAAAIGLLPSVPAIRSYEHEVENGSVLTDWILPPIQSGLARFGAGNEKAYCGVRGWLFYRPDVDYVTDKGFLEPEVLRARARKSDGAPIQPDPLPAIVRLGQQLKERGIDLIVMPVPSKPMIQPEKLNTAFSAGMDALQNPSFRTFCNSLRRDGVRLFDCTSVLIDAKRQTCRPQFLETDTHWTPEAMERVAAALADVIRAEKLLPDSGRVAYARRMETVENPGDIALMLRLPPNQKLFAPQRVEIHPIYAPTGEPWRPARDADVLLLGDSYTSIYSLGGMGWGKGAGLAEELSLALQRPIDRIAINDGGSYTTREELIREFARGRDRLRGKRLVIWQFAMRDLTEGDWKLLDLPGAPPVGGTPRATR